MNIKLTDDEIEYLIYLAGKRNGKQKIFGACTYGGGRYASDVIHMIGLVGEMAVAKSLGKKIDTRIYKFHGDNGIDVDGWGVKNNTKIIDPYLRVETHLFNENAKGYVLCVHAPEISIYDVKIIGWATIEEVRCAPQKVFVANGPLNYYLREHQLRDWKPIVEKALIEV